MTIHVAPFATEQRTHRASLSLISLVTLLACLAMALAGCGGSGPVSPPVVNPTAPTNLVYPQTTLTGVVGQAIPADTPTVTGTVTGYTVSPALPAGLSLGASTGTISGTPTSVAAQAAYTVTASNAGGSATAAIQIAVNPAPPTGLVYPQTLITATVGQPIATDTPTVTGIVTGFSVSPALPAGLSLNASTGAISGTPTLAAAQATYVVTATNASGSTPASLQIVVQLAPPANLLYPQTVITATVGQAIATDTPTVTGTVTSYTVTPALPAGLSLSPSTGAISGRPTTVATQTSYTITAANASGSAMATVQIVVNAAPPTSLVYPQTSLTATVGLPITTDTPTVTGTVTSYTINPALPAGLSLDAVTGAISGTPTAVSAQTPYVVTASNGSGSTTASLTIAVSSFSVHTLLDLGHTNPLSFMRLQPGRLFTQDGTGHWALWDYGSTAEIASGDATPPYDPADMAGPVVAIGVPNAVQIRSSADGSLITTLTASWLNPPAGGFNWWKLATDGSYVASGYTGGLFVWSTTDGHLLLSRTGDYSLANAFAAPGQVQIAKGPAGASVIETVAVATATSSTGPAFTGSFNAWFTDGSHFLSNGPNLSGPGSLPLYTVYTYSAGSVQEGMVNLNLFPGTTLHGYGNWFWSSSSADGLTLYPVGGTTPAATYTVGSIGAYIPSGSTIGMLPYGTGSASIVDISGSTPVRTDVPLPVAYEAAFAAISATQWAVGNNNGVVLDGPSTATTTRFFGYGNAFSMAGAPGRAVVATASGRILTLDPSAQTLLNTINFTSSKVALSADGTILAAKASDVDNQFEPDRSLNIYSLPAGTLTNTFPYTYNPVLGSPTLFDFNLSGSGTAVGQLIGTYNGLYFDYTRQVTPLSGSPVLWSDHPASGPYNANTPLLLSPDGTLIATSAGDYSSTSTASIYKNGVLAATVNGFAVGWIDNNRLLVNTFVTNAASGLTTYTGAVIYDAAGTRFNAAPSRASRAGSSMVSVEPIISCGMRRLSLT